ncbi:MAG TPA: MarR family transcriptional regulator [Acidimicrobiales bacterium]|nr:MarR family transcriptional regulator [Acidimicrobiales bacterium]
MGGRLRSEIKRKGPFAGAELEAFLNLQRTADALARGLAEALKPAGLSGPQYNILRILRGAGAGGCVCRELGERMVTRDPDITRLLDRLEARDLVARERGREDRRVVKTRVTEKGLRLLESLDAPVADLHRRLLGHLGARRLRALIELLEVARERAR